MVKPRPPAHFAFIAVLLALGPALNARGPTPTALGQATLIHCDTTQTVPTNSPDEIQVTSACQNGEQLVSGGYGLNSHRCAPSIAD